MEISNNNVTVYIRRKSSTELEKKLETNFNKNQSTFDDCVKWYRELIKYLFELTNPSVFYSPENKLNNGLFYYYMNELGGLTYRFTKVNNSIKVFVEDFYFNEYGVMEFKKRFNSILEYMNKNKI